MPTFTEYKFRAEVMHDVARYLLELCNLGIVVDIVTIKRDDGLPDCEVALATNVNQAKMIAAALSLIDGHVIAETINLARYYTGERFYDRSNRK